MTDRSPPALHLSSAQHDKVRIKGPQCRFRREARARGATSTLQRRIVWKCLTSKRPI